MSAGFELVVTDLDGSLWSGPEVLHARTGAALTELGRRGIPVAVATGRRTRSAAMGLARHDLRLPAIVLNGAYGIDLTDGTVFWRRSFTREAASAVWAAFDHVGLSPCLYMERSDVDVYVGPAPSTCPAHLAGLGAAAVRGDLAAVCRSDVVYGFGLLGGPETTLRAVAGVIAEQGVGQVVLSPDGLFGGFSLTVAPPRTSKWDGVRALCAAYGLDAGRVLAVGDGDNDVTMLTEAALGVCVADGCAAALAVADRVIAPAERGGWADIIDLLDERGRPQPACETG